jgi:hypothetical protein
MVLVGDVFFRRNVVMFDLSGFPGPITIGIARRNPNYKLATEHAYVSKIQAHKKLPQVHAQRRGVSVVSRCNAASYSQTGTDTSICRHHPCLGTWMRTR